MTEEIIKALTKNTANRTEVVAQAFAKGVFADKLTHKYLAQALSGNEYNELANYLEEIVIPAIGVPMLPHLRDTFTFADTYDNLRRLRLLRQLKFHDIKHLADEVLAQNLPLLQTEAIAVLADSNTPDNEEKVISLATDKNRFVREAAYKALAQMGTQRTLETLLSIYRNKPTRTNMQLLVAALSQVTIPTHYLAFLSELQQCYHNLLTIDTTNEKQIIAAYNLFNLELGILQHKDYPEVYAFLEDMLYNSTFHAIAEAYDTVPFHLMPNVAAILNTFPTDKAIAFYEKHLKTLPIAPYTGVLAKHYFSIATEVYTKEQIYDAFSPVFSLMSQKIIETFSGYQYNAGYYTPLKFEVKPIFTDPRWAEVLLHFLENDRKGNDYELKALVVLDVLLPNSETLNQQILQLLPKASLNDTSWLYQLIMKRNMPQRFEVIYQSLSTLKQAKHCDYMNVMQEKTFWQLFPKEYASKFEALYTTIGAPCFKEIAEQLAKK